MYTFLLYMFSKQYLFVLLLWQDWFNRIVMYNNLKCFKFVK